MKATTRFFCVGYPGHSYLSGCGHRLHRHGTCGQLAHRLAPATAPALILVGFLMAQTAGEIDYKNLEEAIPAFLTIIMIPLTHSISRGVGAGLVTLFVIKVMKGKVKDLNWLTILVSLLFIVDMLDLWGKIFR